MNNPAQGYQQPIYNQPYLMNRSISLINPFPQMVNLNTLAHLFIHLRIIHSYLYMCIPSGIRPAYTRFQGKGYKKMENHSLYPLIRVYPEQPSMKNTGKITLSGPLPV